MREFLKFTEKVAEEAPDQDAPLLLGGVEALQDELAWMEVLLCTITKFRA